MAGLPSAAHPGDGWRALQVRFLADLTSAGIIQDWFVLDLGKLNLTFDAEIQELDVLEIC